MKNFIQELLLVSQEVIKKYFNSHNLEISNKKNNTPVTIADQQAETVMRKLINQRFPEHGIIGEEFGSENPDAEYVWVLDPIDGTIAFIHGVPLFVTLIALLKNKQPIWGAISQPITNLTCIGDNQICWFNNQITHVREAQSISQATLLTTDMINMCRLHNKIGFEKLINKVKLFRTWGDGFGYLLLSSGKADIMIDAKMAPWDILPVIPVVRGAGAKITTIYNKDPVTGNSAIVAHPKIYSQILEILQIS